MSARVSYVAGLLFSEHATTVVLVRKNRPAWQAGKLNAVGGKIEPGETPLEAMRREFREEAGLDIADWTPTAILSGDNFEVHFFAAFSELYMDARTMETEEIVRAGVGWALNWHECPHLIPNLRVIIPLALDDTGIAKPVLLTDLRAAA